MENYKISMIIPTFNAEKDLKTAISSLMKQTIGFENIEVLLVDDLSTDNTRQVILDYAKKFNNIKYIFLDSNSGTAGKPRNIGVENASSKYIMFLDNDDEYIPEACEILYNEISKTDVNLIFCSRANRIYDQKDKPDKINETPIFKEVNVLKKPEVLYEPISNYPGAMWNKIFKKEFIQKNNIKCLEKLPEDEYFMHQCYYLNPNVLFLTNLKLYNHYFYRVEGQSVSVTLSAKFLKKLFITFSKLAELSTKSEDREIFFNQYCSNFFSDMANFITFSQSTDEDKIELIKEYEKYGSKFNPNIKSKVYSLWYKLACSKQFKLTLIYSKIIKFLSKLRNL